MPKNPFPSYDQYPKDFLTSENVMAMTLEAECAYRRLLDWAWLGNPPCTLPASEAILADLSKARDRWPEVRDQVLPMFERVGARLRNKKQHEIFRGKLRFRAEKKYAGIIGGRKSAELRAKRSKQNPSRGQAEGQAESNLPSSSSSPSFPSLEEAKLLPTQEDSSSSKRNEKSSTHERSSSRAWESYAAAYKRRYGVAPTRNATVNAQMAQFVRRVPGEEAPEIAAFYVGHPGAFYAQNAHPVGLLLKDAEKLRTEWQTGKTVTATKARRDERTASNVFLGLVAEERAKGEGQ